MKIHNYSQLSKYLTKKLTEAIDLLGRNTISAGEEFCSNKLQNSSIPRTDSKCILAEYIKVKVPEIKKLKLNVSVSGKTGIEITKNLTKEDYKILNGSNIKTVNNVIANTKLLVLASKNNWLITSIVKEFDSGWMYEIFKKK